MKLCDFGISSRNPEAIGVLLQAMKLLAQAHLHCFPLVSTLDDIIPLLVHNLNQNLRNLYEARLEQGFQVLLYAMHYREHSCASLGS